MNTQNITPSALSAAWIAGQTHQKFIVHTFPISAPEQTRPVTLAALVSHSLCDVPSSPLHAMLKYIGAQAAAGDTQAEAVIRATCAELVESQEVAA